MGDKRVNLRCERPFNLLDEQEISKKESAADVNRAFVSKERDKKVEKVK